MPYLFFVDPSPTGTSMLVYPRVPPKKEQLSELDGYWWFLLDVFPNFDGLHPIPEKTSNREALGSLL